MSETEIKAIINMNSYDLSKMMAIVLRISMSIGKLNIRNGKTMIKELRLMKTMKEVLSGAKRWLGIFAIASLVFSGCVPAGAQHVVVVSDYNIDELSSYGEWVSIQPYGRAWKPNVDRDWAPFYYGHWDYSEANWTWISYEPFGWIVYHYGNWAYTPEYGWVWIPADGDWSPATVEWMFYDDYVCWAPLPPAGVVWPRPWERYGGGIEVWSVVHAKDFVSGNVGEHRVAGVLVRPDEQRVQIINRFPDPKMIERYAGRPVPSVKIERQSVRVGTQQLHKMRVPESDQQQVEKYRPQVERRVTRRSSGEHR